MRDSQDLVRFVRSSAVGGKAGRGGIRPSGVGQFDTPVRTHWFVSGDWVVIGRRRCRRRIMTVVIVDVAYRVVAHGVDVQKRRLVRITGEGTP